VTGLGESAEGQTQVDADDAQYLTEEYSRITTRDELNDAEASNIADGLLWLGDQEPPSPTSSASKTSESSWIQPATPSASTPTADRAVYPNG